MTQFQLVTKEKGTEGKYSLSELYSLSNNVILNERISAIFSNEVKFNGYQLKIYNPENLAITHFFYKERPE